MPDLIAYALALLSALVPYARAPRIPTWTETPEAYAVRLVSIAADIGAVSRTRRDVAALVGVARHESGFAADVDAGQCYRGPGWETRCDGGRAVSIWQMQDASGEHRALYRFDRRAAAREALRRINGSLVTCAHNEPRERLAAFASGTCAHGHATARGLDAAVRRALAIVPPT